MEPFSPDMSPSPETNIKMQKIDSHTNGDSKFEIKKELGKESKKDEDSGYHTDGGKSKKGTLEVTPNKKLTKSPIIGSDNRMNLSPSLMGSDCYRLRKIDWI